MGVAPSLGARSTSGTAVSLPNAYPTYKYVLDDYIVGIFGNRMSKSQKHSTELVEK